MNEQLKSCPYSDCNNTGAYPTMPDGEPEQCQFCYEEPDSVFNVINTLQSRIKELKTQAWNQEAESTKASVDYVKTINDLTAENERLRTVIYKSVSRLERDNISKIADNVHFHLKQALKEKP